MKHIIQGTTIRQCFELAEEEGVNLRKVTLKRTPVKGIDYSFHIWVLTGHKLSSLDAVGGV